MRKFILLIFLFFSTSIAQVNWMESGKLTGDINFRKSLAKKGVELTFDYKGEFFFQYQRRDRKKIFLSR